MRRTLFVWRVYSSAIRSRSHQHSAEVCVCDEGGRRAKRRGAVQTWRHVTHISQRVHIGSHLSSTAAAAAEHRKIYIGTHQMLSGRTNVREQLYVSTLYIMQGSFYAIYFRQKDPLLFLFFLQLGDDNHRRYFWPEKKKCFSFLCNRKHQWMYVAHRFISNNINCDTLMKWNKELIIIFISFHFLIGLLYIQRYNWFSRNRPTGVDIDFGLFISRKDPHNMVLVIFV